MIRSGWISCFGVVLLGFGLAASADAGAVIDSDGDLVPDAYDNCVTIPNGPGELSNQLDSDRDGYGNRCDADFDDSGRVTGVDFNRLIRNFAVLGNRKFDLNGDGIASGADVTILIELFNKPPGPSGLSCAGAMPCLP